MDPQKRIEELQKIIQEHNHAYYVLDTPTISDYEFDILLKELEQLERENPIFISPQSPTQRVGSVVKSFHTEFHKERMYSLDNSYDASDLIDWEQRMKKVLGDVALSYTCELKYDGASISLTYEKGLLVKALTRETVFKETMSPTI